MNISTIIILAVTTMVLATFASPRDCRHACRMDANGVTAAADQRMASVISLATPVSTRGPQPAASAH